MPIFEYQCPCGLRFEANVSRSKREEPRVCSECGDTAFLTLPASVAGHFRKDVTGAGPQNTGIADLDAHIDRVIGKSAEQGWAVQEQRADEKRQVMASTGVSGGHLSRTVDGEYLPIGDAEKAAHERALAIHTAAMDWKTQQENKKRGPR